MPFQGASSGKLFTPYGDNVSIDTMTDALNVVDYAHHEIHAGSHFHASRTVNLGNGASVDVLITTPNTTKHAHMVGSIGVELESHMYFYENPNVTGGTAIAAYNRNRNSATTAGVTVKHTPTVNSTGTLITESHFGSGRAAGGERRENAEWVLKQNEDYLLRVTNATANENYVTILLDWYEHTTP